MSVSVQSFRFATRLAAVSLALLLAVAPSARAQIAGLTGTLVVTNKTPSTATIVDVASGRTLATLPTGTNPHEIVAVVGRRAWPWSPTTAGRAARSR